MPLPRMRTAVKVMDELKALDPDTAVSLHFVRWLIKTRKVPIVEVGRKKLVNLDLLLEYLAQGSPIEEEQGFGQIRKVPQ